MNRAFFSSVRGVVAGLVCVLAVGCTPSIDQAAKTSVDRQLAALQPSSAVHDARDASAPAPFSVGQWVRYRTIDDEGRPTIGTHEVIAVDGPTVTVRSTTESYYGRSVTTAVATFADRVSPESVELVRLVTEDQHGVREMNPALIDLMGGVFAAALENMNVSWVGRGREDVTTPAGTFRGCYTGQQVVSIAGLRFDSVVHWHPDVPLGGMVSGRDVDGEFATELIAYGDDGVE